MAASDENQFHVYFRKGEAGLAQAAEALALHDLSSTPLNSLAPAEAFTVAADGFGFVVRLDESPSAASEAKNVAAAAAMAGLATCDARFAVEVVGLPAALDEINTMMELQGALQDCCGGYLVLGWNGGIVEPWTLEES